MFAPSTPMRRGFGIVLAAVLVTSGCAAGRDSQTSNQIPTQDGTNADVGSMALRGLSLEAPGSGTSYAAGSAVPMRLVLVNNGTSDDKMTNVVTTVARGWASYRTAAQAAAAAGQENSSTTPGSSGPSASTTPGTSDTPTASTSSTAAGKEHRKQTSASSSTSTVSSPTSSPTSTPTTSSSSSSVTSGAETAVTIPAGQRVSWGVPDSQRVLLLLSSVGRIYPGSTVKITFTFSKAGSVTVAVPVQLSSEPGDTTISAGPGSDG